MFAIHRKSTGPSAAELLEATRKEYVKTEALKNAKIDPGRPRIFSHDDGGDEGNSASTSRVRLRRRIPVQPSNSPDLICFCVTSTPKIRPSSYKPLETPHGAFHRVGKQPMMSRAKSTPTRPHPGPPPPRPPKPLWLMNPSLLGTSDKLNEDIKSTKDPKPVPAPRPSKQSATRQQTMSLPYGGSLTKKEGNAAEVYPELEKLRVSSCSADGNVASKTVDSLTTTPSTSRGTMSPCGGRCTRNSTHEVAQNDGRCSDNLTSPDSDSGLHHSSVESLDNPFYNMIDSSNADPSNCKLVQVQAANRVNDVRLEVDDLCHGFMGDDRATVAVAPLAIIEERSTSVEMSQIGSEASIFTSVTAAYHASSAASLSRGSSENADHMAGAWSHLGAEPSLIEKNARVIKWIYSCRTAVA
ncbi:hypothetical protein Tcan_06529 [Toxocara canis]|uniref:Centrosome-associated FAM110 C-terminal domain-containing protein n=1 Tax=Toxocara canis TaxID=6265 RepID=A0A0B2VWH1_TOXCA|nr:hypothetical protein Tcan_06529 [Toxocara canis]